jgi:hypothetical protein
LSDFKPLGRHFRVVRLFAPSLEVSVAAQALNDEDGGPGDCVLGLQEAEKQRKRRYSFAKTKRAVSRSGRKPLKSLAVGNEHFAEFFVFKNLSAFLLRLFLP